MEKMYDLFFKPLPPSDMDFSKFQPFIKSEWFRKHFMKFVYTLQIVLILISMVLGIWNFSNWLIKIAIFCLVFVIHELLHILVVYGILIWQAIMIE